MANWQRRCSSPPAHRTDRRRLDLLPVIALFAGGCGHAGEQATPPLARAAVQPADIAAADAAQPTGAAGTLCLPASTGALRARLQGAIDAEIDWGPDAPHCQAGVRPRGDGVRLIYKGTLPETGPLLLVFGLSPLRPGESARNVPVNLTIVREGSGQFFATQGEGKCALDSVTQLPLPGATPMYRLEGRGYCTQPARAVTGDGSVMVSRFDVVATIPANSDAPDAGKPVAGTTR